MTSNGRAADSLGHDYGAHWRDATPGEHRAAALVRALRAFDDGHVTWYGQRVTSLGLYLPLLVFAVCNIMHIIRDDHTIVMLEDTSLRVVCFVEH